MQEWQAAMCSTLTVCSSRAAQGTGWCFPMLPPSPLIGQANPHTGRPLAEKGVRLEEVASLEFSLVVPDARWYEARNGKTENAPRSAASSF